MNNLENTPDSAFAPRAPISDAERSAATMRAGLLGHDPDIEERSFNHSVNRKVAAEVLGRHTTDPRSFPLPQTEKLGFRPYAGELSPIEKASHNALEGMAIPALEPDAEQPLFTAQSGEDSESTPPQTTRIAMSEGDIRNLRDRYRGNSGKAPF